MKTFTGLCKKCGKQFTVKGSSYYYRVRRSSGFDYCGHCLRWTDALKAKRKQTKLEKYGNPNYNNREKAKITCLERYGVDNVTKVEQINKTRDFSRTQCSEIREKRKQTCLEKYGVESTTQIPSVVEARATYYKDSLRKRNTQEKRKQTCLDKYGVINGFLLKDKNMPRGIFYDFDGKSFESSWELYFYIFLKEHNIQFIYKPKPPLIYFIGEERHLYYPDFKINKVLVEIKGDLYIKNGMLFNPYTKQFLKEKTECLKDNKVKILQRKHLNNVFNYIFKKYGKKYCNKFKRKV